MNNMQKVSQLMDQMTTEQKAMFAYFLLGYRGDTFGDFAVEHAEGMLKQGQET